MRLFPAILLCATTIGAGGAQASSLLALGEAGPSIVAFADEAASPPAGFVAVSPSIIAMEGYAPVADEAAAALASDTTPQRHDEGGSIVVFAAEPAPPPQDFVAVSSSIIAMEEYAPPVTNEKVAAIPQSETKAAPKRRFDPAPMVIRGGIVGDAFARSIPPAVPGEEAEGREPEDSETPMAAADPGMPAEPDPQSPLLHARPPE